MGRTALAAQCASWIQARGFQVRIQDQNVRRIAGTDRWSEHSFGNALDIFGSAGVLDQVANELARNRSRFNISTLCWDGGSFRGGDSCTTKHLDHIHVDFGPSCGSALRTLPGKVSDGELVAACTAFQNGEKPSMPGTPKQGGGGIVGAVTDALTPDFPDLEAGVTRVAFGLAGVIAFGLAVALFVADQKQETLGAVLKGVAGRVAPGAVGR